MKKGKMIPIRTKLLGVILPVVMIIVIVLVAISYSISRATISRSAENLLNTSVDNQVNEISAWLDENLSAFAAVKQGIETLNMTNLQLQQYLNGYYGYNDNCPEGVYIADEMGNLITAQGSQKTETDLYASVWYQEGLKHVNMGLTGAYTNAKGEKIISASGILNNKTGGLRVISADLSLQRLSLIHI